MPTRTDGIYFPINFPASFTYRSSPTGLKFPVNFPIRFGEFTGLTFPISFPMSFYSSSGTQTEGLSFPLRFPMRFYTSSSEVEEGVRFPVTFPFMFKHNRGEREVTIKIPIKFTAFTGVYNGQAILPYNETASGKTTSVPFKETAWWFPGLFLEENIISEMHAELNVAENIQALILADFELESANRVKVSWYGHTVPSLTIMKKSDADDEYTASGTYGWDEGEATFDIASEDYNIYLKGTSNSGSSSVYTIGGTSDVVVIPTVEVSLNEKIYDLEIDNTSKYHIIINY